MPGLLWNTYREGNRCEYLAQFVLSALGVASPVPRQEDIGVDFYCALADEDGPKLTFHSPFSVQVGSEHSKKFRYGSDINPNAAKRVRKKKSKKAKKAPTWKKEEVDWLFAQSLPLFVATVDTSAARVRIFSTSAMWIARYSYGTLGQVFLEPDLVCDPAKEIRSPEATLPAGFGDQHTYRIPLCAPVVDLSFADLKTETVKAARLAMKKAVQVETKNIRYRDLGVHFVEWLLDIKPNDDAPLMKVGHFYAWNDQPGANTQVQLEGLLPICIALAQNFKAQQRMVEYRALSSIFSLIPREKIPSFVQSDLQDLLSSPS